ncbi:hypothetical protein Bca52824_019124 [Brassica carinata]|uniref:Uncharacterized protein n=1 Tax=Brassica carinata TaxID=52824 RepID=A0A8X8B036_BRACI|nr:hypothetical protein Bca52824_019124 [Brassica carinata]
MMDKPGTILGTGDLSSQLPASMEINATNTSVEDPAESHHDRLSLSCHLLQFQRLLNNHSQSARGQDPSNHPEKQLQNTYGAPKWREPITPSAANEPQQKLTTLTKELEEMFEIQGQFLPHNKWIVVFTDDEGDMMLSGDRSMEVSNYHM